MTRIVFGTEDAYKQNLKDALFCKLTLGELIDGNLSIDHPDVVKILGIVSDEDDINAIATDLLIDCERIETLARHVLSGKTRPLDRFDTSIMAVPA